MKNYINLFLIVFSILLIISCENKEEKTINNLPEQPNKINPLKIGDSIPDIILKDVHGNDFNLKQEISKKQTILIYYRGGWCLYCNQHLGQIHEIEQQLFDLGFQIIAISADLPENISKTIDKHSLNYTIISDSEMKGALAFGLAYNAANVFSEDMLKVLEKHSGEKHHILPVPAAFIVSRDGIINFEYINPNYKIRIAPLLLKTAASLSLKE